ncbi:MAG: YaaL family protein [Planococcaceae bacterium]|uniref:YaaL family protein n=1 Tax=Paenisporosarcina quisquiliarum TaxID=365346 RepID=UPI00242792BC|nr:YaaL family protein [Bacillota bacterium]MDX1770662.1 YaaL family protein [Planococcaceae bacterium]
MFFRKGKLKKEFDENLIRLIRETNEDWKNAQVIEDFLDDYDLSVIAQRKIAESKHFFLFKEAKIRKILLK